MKPSRKSLHLFRADQLFSGPIYTVHAQYEVVEVLCASTQCMLQNIMCIYFIYLLNIHLLNISAI